MEQGHHVASIGKLHYAGTDAKRDGFDEEILPLHIVNGVGDLLGLIRDELPRRAGALKLGPEAGPGESEYTRYDRSIAEATCRWLAQAARQPRGKPWALYVGFVSPALSPDRAARVLRALSGRPGALAGHVRSGRAAAAPVHRRDAQVHVLRRAVRRADGAAGARGLLRARHLPRRQHRQDTARAGGRRASSAETRVIYSSDHGDNLGTRGMWGKSTMYEESAGIPLIMAGRGCARRASLRDRR